MRRPSPTRTPRWTKAEKLDHFLENRRIERLVRREQQRQEDQALIDATGGRIDSERAARIYPSRFGRVE